MIGRKESRTGGPCGIVASTLAPAAALLLWAAPAAQAHLGGGGLGGAVETRFQMPLWVVLAAGAGVVGLTFAVVGAFLTRSPVPHEHEPGRPRRHDVTGTGRLLGWLSLASLLVIALHGVVPGAGGLFPEVAVWLLLWGALPLLAYLVVDPWPWASPLAPLSPVARWLRGSREPAGYPSWLATWPAVALLLGLVGLEVWGGFARDPVVLGRLVIGYTLLTLAGMTVFGRRTWLEHGEVVGVMLSWWGAVSPLRREPGGWSLEAPGRRLGALGARDPSEVALLVALLYGVNFDGFLATGTGARALQALSAIGDGPAFVLLLLAGYTLFLAAFWLCAAAVARLARTLEPTAELARRFAVSLLPIAVAYHLAHTGPSLVENAPLAASALADPLGLGWHLFPAPGPWAFPEAWAPVVVVLQMAVIVIGHAVAVVSAHHVAFGAFPSRVQAVKSEVPLALVMVAYTLAGLWIISQGGAAA